VFANEHHKWALFIHSFFALFFSWVPHLQKCGPDLHRIHTFRFCDGFEQYIVSQHFRYLQSIIVE
jgi:hypothetical protein